MSWTDEEIDALVRDAANEMKVAYKDDYWKEMDAILGDSKRKRRGVAWWWMGGGSAALLLTGFTVWSIVSTDTFRQEQLAVTNETTTGHTGSENTTTSEMERATEMTTTEAALPENEMETTVSTEEVPADAHVHAYAKSTPATNQSKTIGSSDPTQAGSPKNETIAGAKDTKTTRVADRKSDFSNDATVETKKTEGLLVTDIKTTENASKGTTTPVDVADLNEKGWYSEPYSAMIRTDYSYEPPFIPRKRLGFYVRAAGGAGLSYRQTEADNALYQIGADAGLEWFRQNWSFSAGIGIRQQFVSNLHLTKREEFYAFGVVSVDHNLNYDRLVFVDVPVSASYLFGRSTFSLDLAPTYTAGVRLGYTREMQEQTGPNNVVSTSENAGHEYVTSPNFARFGLNAGLTYGYGLKGKLFLETRVSSRVGPSLLVGDFGSNQRTLPIMVELGLKKRF